AAPSSPVGVRAATRGAARRYGSPPTGENARVRVSAKVDYAVRAAIELATAEPGRPVKGERIAQAQEIPLKFLENILADLRHAGLVRSQRGVAGGYWLALRAEKSSVAVQLATGGS